MVEATGGQYTDEVTGGSRTLSTKLRAVGVWQGAQQRVSLSAYSEVAVRFLESAASPNWSADAVASANSVMAQWLNAPSPTDFRPFDLVHGTDLAAASDNDFNVSWALGGFSGMVNRVPVSSGQDPVEMALSKLKSLIASRQVADDALPYLLKGYYDYTELIPSDRIVNKASLETGLLTGVSSSSVSIDDLASYVPNGVATGGAIQSMPDNQFLLVRSGWDSQSTGGTDTVQGTLFNDRGALVAYQLPGVADYRTIYSASVAEVYGDGEMGFGRWNGGVVGKAMLSGDELQTFSQPEVVGIPGESYAVAKPPTQIPSCGLVTMNQAASLQPFIKGDYPANTVPDFKGLRSDSKAAVQFVGGVSYVGLDLFFVYTDGTVQHLTTPGGLTAPWASGVKVEANGRFQLSNDASPSMLLNGMLAGAGGRKMIFRMQLQKINSSNPWSNEQVVAFSAPDASLDASGCATSAGSTGAGVSAPLPVSGSGYVLAAATDQYFDQTLDKYGYYSVVFGPTGLWQSATANEPASVKSWSVPTNSPSYDVYGNASAIIGRAGGDLLEGDASRAFVPYALVKQTATLPVVGSKHYVMIASTAVVSSLGTSSGTGLAQGHITSATIDINYDQTVAPGAPPRTLLQEAVFLTINGTIAGAPFTFTNPVDSTGQIQALSLYRPAPGSIGGLFGGSDAMGLIAGDNAEYVAFVLRTKVGAVPVSTAILLKAQP